MYRNIKESLEDIFCGEDNFISNSANFASLLYHSLQDINWVGFYLESKGNLILGPFQGKIACMKIPYGKGVCGTSASNRKTLIVDDVHSFPGHIACDAASASEIVVPLIKDGHLYGVLDIDSPIRNRFNVTDKEELEIMVNTLLNFSNMDALKAFYNYK